LIFATAGGEKEAAAECLVEKQVELVSFGEDPIMVVATL